MQVKDLNEVNVIDQTIMSIHQELNQLYSKRATLMTGKTKANKRTKKVSLKDIDLSTIDLSLDD